VTRTAKALFAFATLLVVAAAAAAGVWYGVESLAQGHIYEKAEDVPPAKAALVLGSSRLVRNYVANPFFYNRIDAAAALYKAGKVEYLIVSGNQARGGRPRGGYDEPADMRDALIAAGVPAERIYRDYAGFRTLDSVLRAKEIFGQGRVVVVSQHFHLARALFLARRHGIDDDGFQAGEVPLRYGFQTHLREVGARFAAVLDVLRGREPRYGGDPVRLGQDPPT
jgi:SanA protein